MNRTRALIIIGGFMLALAVLAALELQKDDKVTAEGQMVTGTVDKTAPVTTPATQPSVASGTPGAPAAAATSATPATSGTAAIPKANTGSMPETPSSGGVLVPLDNGTLRAPAGGPATLPRVPSAATAEAPAGENTQQAAPLAVAGASSMPSEKPAPATSAGPNNSGLSNSAAPDAARKTAAQNAPGQTPSAPAKAAPAAPATPAKPTAAASDKSGTAAKKDVDEAKPLVLTAKGPAKLQGKQKAITQTRLELGKAITLRLTGAAPLTAKTLLLEGPDRYVVDLQGEWAVNLPRVPKNLLLKGVRAGQREEATRLVLELSRKPESAEVVKIDAKTIEVRIR